MTCLFFVTEAKVEKNAAKHNLQM